MAPAITAIPETPEGETRPTCVSCMGILSDYALKCSHCQGHVHLSCSRLPEYQLIRLTISQSSFSCADCVKSKDAKGDGDKYDNELTKLNETIAKEESIIQQLQTDANKSTNEANNQPNLNAEQVAGQLNSNSARVTDQRVATKPVCRYFLRKECRHGVTGNGCKFEHPKLCFKYIRNGNKFGGCKKEQCRFYHPKLCNESLKERKCLKTSCKFYHVKGTRREEDCFLNSSPVRSNIQAMGNGALEKRTYSAAVQGRNSAQVRVPAQEDEIHTSTPNRQDDMDFLSMKTCMRELSAQITQLIAAMSSPKRDDQCCSRTGRH